MDCVTWFKDFVNPTQPWNEKLDANPQKNQSEKSGWVRFIRFVGWKHTAIFKRPYVEPKSY